MTLDELEKIPREFLLPGEVAKVLGCDAHAVRLMSRERPEKLGFPTIVMGCRTKIPKAYFLAFMRGTLPLYGKEEPSNERGDREV